MGVSRLFDSGFKGSISGPLIVFEAGPTHTGLESAIQLARLSREAGADAIKFQVTDHNRLIANSDLLFTYSAINKDGEVYSVQELSLIHI